MGLIRDVPTLSFGHPDDYVAALASALQRDRIADASFAFSARMGKLTTDQLRQVAGAVAAAPFDVSPSVAFETAMAEFAPPTPPAPPAA